MCQVKTSKSENPDGKVRNVSEIRKTIKFVCLRLTQADDLGRIVIPKEIRRTLRIRDGDLLRTTRAQSDGYIWAMDALLKRLGEDSK